MKVGEQGRRTGASELLDHSTHTKALENRRYRSQVQKHEALHGAEANRL
jgi:hypothetical protein